MIKVGSFLTVGIRRSDFCF